MDAEDIMDVGITDAGITGAEGGDLDCYPSLQSFSVRVPLSTGFIPWVRLTIATATGTTITKTLVIPPNILGELENMITLQISGTVSILQPTGSEGDDS